MKQTAAALVTRLSRLRLLSSEAKLMDYRSQEGAGRKWEEQAWGHQTGIHCVCSNFSAPLSLGFLIHRMGIIILTLRGLEEN